MGVEFSSGVVSNAAGVSDGGLLLRVSAVLGWTFGGWSRGRGSGGRAGWSAVEGELGRSEECGISCVQPQSLVEQV